MAKIIYHFPMYYEKSLFINNITSSFDLEIKKIKEYSENVKKQFIVNTADYTLNRYEEEYGLPVDPQGITIQERRSRIIARMRVAGTITKKLIESIVESWSNADVNIIENYSQYEIIVEFVSVAGIPSNMQDVYNALREVIPAHLGIVYKFKYLTWDLLDSWVYNWNEFDLLNISWDNLEVKITR